MSRAILLGLLVAFALEALVFSVYGRTLIDEGVYLVAARRVYEGDLLYRDFPFSQGPTFPYVYGLFTWLFGSSLEVGRALAWLGCLVSVVAGALFARRVRGAAAASIVVVLAMLDLPALWVLTTTRTQALATPLFMLGMLALTVPARSALGWSAAPSLLLWATGTRLTHGLAFVGVLLWVGHQLRGAPRLRIRVAAIVGVQALVLAAPFVLAFERARFHVLTSQLTRTERGGFRHESLLDRLGGKLAFLFEPSGLFLLLLLLGVVAAVALAWQASRGWRPAASLPLRDARSAQLVLLVMALLAFAPHLVFQHGHLPYFATSALLLAVAIGIAVPDWMAAPRRRVVGTALACALLAVSLGRAWTAAGTWLGFGGMGVARVGEIGREIRALAGPECTMLTFQTHLAVASGCRVLPGLEYSVFSFFPELPSAEAERRGVLNRELLAQRVAAQRPEILALGSLELGRFGSGSDGADLDFLPDGGDAYRLYGRCRLPSGMRMAGFAGWVPLRIYVRRDLSAPSAGDERKRQQQRE